LITLTFQQLEESNIDYESSILARKSDPCL
jgi:hypothetical protein